MTEQIWIKHTESGEPMEFEDGERVCYRLRDGTEGVQQAGWLDWSIEGHPGDVVEWFPVAGMKPAPVATVKQAGPTGVEKQVCDLIAQRQLFGLNKYKTTVADNPLSLREWLQHALEETLDKAIYLKRAINEIDAKADDGK